MKKLLLNGLIVLLGIMAFLFVCLLIGCEDDGRVGPSRMAGGIAGGTDGVNTGWFAYLDALGNVMEQPGVRMNFEVSAPSYLYWSGVDGWVSAPAPDTQTIEGGGPTGPGGRVIARGRRTDNWQTYQYYIVTCHARVQVPHDATKRAFFNYNTRANPRGEKASVLADGQPIPQFTLPPHRGRAANLSESEFDALTQPTESIPDNGIQIVSYAVVVQDGFAGGGFTHPLSSLTAIDLDSDDLYVRYSAPLMFSYVFTTAEPAHFVGMTLTGNVRTDACTDGIDVEFRVVASGVDLMTHVAQTEPFLPVRSDLEFSRQESIEVYNRWTAFPEPNLWDEGQYVREVKSNWQDFIDPNLLGPDIDPNNLFDPTNPDFFDFYDRLDTSLPNFFDIAVPERFMAVKVIPLDAQGDYLRFRLKQEDSRTMLAVIDHWLSDNRVFDMNGDGIVNYEDLIFQVNE